MGRKKRTKDVAENTADDIVEQEEALEQEVDDELTELRQQMGELQGKLQEMQERLLRQQADFDNVRKRLRREMQETGDRSVARFVAPLLTEMDNFEHALKAASPDNFQDFATGVSMIRENILGTFSGAGIEPVPAEGVFNPSMHEVVAEIEHPDAPRGTILEVFRTGYRLHDQIIRAAQVVVARPPAVMEEAAGGGGDDDDEEKGED